MMDYSQQLPVFVYGTLRPGCGNYGWALADTTTREVAATLADAVMHAGPGYPHVIDGPAVVTGVLIDIDAGRCGQVMAVLDQLEGFRPGSTHNLYNRVVRTVTTPDGPRRAWVYVYAGMPTGPVVASGDWLHQAVGPVGRVA